MRILDENRAEKHNYTLDDLDDDFERAYGPEALKRELLNITRNARINYKGNQEHHNFLRNTGSLQDYIVIKNPQLLKSRGIDDVGFADRYTNFRPKRKPGKAED